MQNVVYSRLKKIKLKLKYIYMHILFHLSECFHLALISLIYDHAIFLVKLSIDVGIKVWYIYSSLGFCMLVLSPVMNSPGWDSENTSVHTFSGTLSLPLFLSAFHLVAQQIQVVSNIKPHVSGSTLWQKVHKSSQWKFNVLLL